MIRGKGKYLVKYFESGGNSAVCHESCSTKRNAESHCRAEGNLPVGGGTRRRFWMKILT